MSFLDQFITPETQAQTRATVLGFASGAGLIITDWIVGAVGEQTFAAGVAMLQAYVKVTSRLTRGFVSLDLATDPGDFDAYDASNAALIPAPGFLSNMGANTHGTTRAGETFATGFATFVNAGIAARSFAPDGLVYTWTGGTPPSPPPTYRNASDASIYTNPDGTVTVGAGVTITIPVVAEEIGTRSNAPSGTLSLTTVFAGCSGTNAAAVLGTAREDADTYRERCRQASARLSFDGPADAYRYFAAKTIDGAPLINANGDVVNITKVYVSEDSTESRVDIYFASPSGPAISDDVDAANDNILTHAFIVPDTITIGPGVPGGITATATSIHVVGTVKIKSRNASLGAAAIKAAIVAALTTAFESDDFNPIGGLDQVSGAGVIYTEDLRAVVRDAFAGLYDVVISTPAGASTAIALGHVATLNSVSADWSVVIV